MVILTQPTHTMTYATIGSARSLATDIVLPVLERVSDGTHT